MFAYMGADMPISAFSLFFPTIIAEMGYIHLPTLNYCRLPRTPVRLCLPLLSDSLPTVQANLESAIHLSP
jgi:hypothetical protein